jgi:hypothetical protein
LVYIVFSSKQAKGEIAFAFQKTRNSDGVGKTIYLNWDAKYLRIKDKTSNNTKLKLATKSNKLQSIKDSILGDMPTGNSLIDIMPN